VRDEILAQMRANVQLPVLPEVLVRIDQELSSVDVDVRSIASIIGMDPVLAGQVLRMANSAYYSRGGGVLTNTGAAVMRLGIHTVRSLVYALSLPGIFPVSAKASPFSHAAFWKHSLGVASFAQALAKRIGMPPSSQDLVYFAGLMHDVGALLFLSILPEGYSAFLTETWDAPTSRPTKPEDSELSRREEERFGISHPELGAIYLKERWKMDGALVRLVREHHRPGWNEEEGLSEVLVVHVADGICSSSGAGWDRNAESQLPFLEPVWEHMGISLEDVDELMTEMQGSLSQAQALLSVQP
jgi:HD-like signal output (HDOD) protein